MKVRAKARVGVRGRVVEVRGRMEGRALGRADQLIAVTLGVAEDDDAPRGRGEGLDHRVDRHRTLRVLRRDGHVPHVRRGLVRVGVGVGVGVGVRVGVRVRVRVRVRVGVRVRACARTRGSRSCTRSRAASRRPWSSPPRAT